ncbi:MAG TPA: 50S ribosomal protein L21 [Pyrinomonadaceae bacterium]|nr:50S ribosomal protein L21 [Pyrinomonadaceae bacterium]
MSHAVIRTGGKQFVVEEGTTIRVPSVKAEAGSSVELDVLVASGDETRVGAPGVEGAKVMATVVDHGRAPKIIVFKKKRRKHYKRKQGHRQDYTTLKIDSIG